MPGSIRVRWRTEDCRFEPQQDPLIWVSVDRAADVLDTLLCERPINLWYTLLAAP
jgi:hypothetical protein